MKINAINFKNSMKIINFISHAYKKIWHMKYDQQIKYYIDEILKYG